MGRHKILGSCKLLALPSKYMSATRGRTPGFHPHGYDSSALGVQPALAKPIARSSLTAFVLTPQYTNCVQHPNTYTSAVGGVHLRSYGACIATVSIWTKQAKQLRLHSGIYRMMNSYN